MSDRDTEIVEKIKAFAAAAHGGQRRKFMDEPYINHPVRVMELCREYTEDISILAAALLHDVLEDTTVKEEALSDFLASVMEKSRAKRTQELVNDLTDVFTKSAYPGLNRRARKKREAERLACARPGSQTIKYADIIDNVTDIVKHHSDFALVFVRECKHLLQKMDKGDPLLYRRALQTVDDSWHLFK